MPLFQQSVAKKYINDLNKPGLQNAWPICTVHSPDAATRENIRNLKEAAYQEGFVSDLFVSVLGYTLHPHKIKIL